MKIFIFNGHKMASMAFGLICAGIILYVGFFSELKTVLVSSTNMQTSYVVVIIDDFGNDTDGTKEFMYSDIPFTGAVMPSMPYSTQESIQLFENGKEVILHMPMEAHNGKKSWLPDKAILSSCTADEAKTLVISSLDEIENCIGINNHMGSKITENEELLKAVLEVCKERNLIFIDSLTTEKSVASKIGEELGVTVLVRDVFLDSTKSQSKIESNLKKAGQVAQKKGYAIAIGHVGEEGGKATINAMKNIKPYFDEQNIKFVTLSEFLEIMRDAEFKLIEN